HCPMAQRCAFIPAGGRRFSTQSWKSVDLRPNPRSNLMEATLPISAAVRSTTRATKPSVAAAPSVSLPLSFILTGLMALAVGLVWLVAQPSLLTTYHYNQNIIALTHLLVLGWLCSVVMGAMYQLVPVALETRLYSERLAKWQFAFHLIG